MLVLLWPWAAENMAAAQGLKGNKVKKCIILLSVRNQVFLVDVRKRAPLGHRSALFIDFLQGKAWTGPVVFVKV